MTPEAGDQANRYLVAEADGLTPLYWVSDIPYPSEFHVGDVIYDSKTDLLLSNDGEAWKVC